MEKCARKIEIVKEEPEPEWSVLEQIAREGARKMLQLALENEVEEFVQKQSTLRDQNGKKVVSKNG